MAVTKRKTRADKVAEQNDGFPTSDNKSWKPPVAGAFGHNPNMSPVGNGWVTLGKKVAAGARLRPRTNAERFTGTRVDYTGYQKKSSTKAHGPAKHVESATKGGKKQVGK